MPQRQFVSGTPLQGQMYHRLVSVIGGTYSGLGPNNVQNASPYKAMTGLAFQKPQSGAAPAMPSLPVRPYR